MQSSSHFAQSSSLFWVHERDLESGNCAMLRHHPELQEHERERETAVSVQK